MTHASQFPAFLMIFMTMGACFVVTSFYLMLQKPEQWLEWFVNRPYRWWGLHVSIVDKERFRKATRTYALIPLFASFLGLFAAIISLYLYWKA